jgi:hypothetical protein
MAERPTNCPSCGKRLSRKQWYYRNGQFYCKKGCWETAKAKAAEERAAKAAQDKPEAPAKQEEPAKKDEPAKAA